MSECDNCLKQNPRYPRYGAAPRRHDFTGPGLLGRAVSVPKNEWPSSFKEDPDASGWGMYYCPNKGCVNSKEKPWWWIKKIVVFAEEIDE